MRSRLALVALAVLVTAMLAGCAAPPPIVSQSPSSTPVAVDDSPASIVVSAEAVSVETTAGSVVESFAYTETPGSVIPMLTKLFGAAPEVTEVPGLEQPAYMDYNWTGFELHVLAEGSAPYLPLRVKVTVTSVADLLVTTTDGLSVGVDADTVAARYPDSTLTFTPPGAAPRYAIALGAADGYTVGLEGETGGPITSIVAPQLG